MNSNKKSKILKSKNDEIKSIEDETDNTNFSSEKNINLNNQKIFVIINKNTEKLMKSTNKTDLIQCALEYNSYLIENLIQEKDNMNKLEFDSALNRLYNNLIILTENFEDYEDKFKITNIIKNNEEEKKNLNKRRNGCNIKNKKDKIHCNSISNLEMELPF